MTLPGIGRWPSVFILSIVSFLLFDLQCLLYVVGRIFLKVGKELRLSSASAAAAAAAVEIKNSRIRILTPTRMKYETKILYHYSMSQRHCFVIFHLKIIEIKERVNNNNNY